MLGSSSGTFAAVIVPSSATAEPASADVHLAEDQLEDQREHRGDQRDPDHRLVHVRHRRPARDLDPQVEAVDLQVAIPATSPRMPSQ